MPAKDDEGDSSQSRTSINSEQIILVALSGPSSSGKSTTAKALHKLLEGSKIVHLDDFYYPDEQIPIDPETKEQNWDCPKAIDFEKFADYVHKLKSNACHTMQIDSLEIEADLQLTEEDTKHFRHKIETYKCILQGKTIVFIDGFMLFHDRKISNLFDIRLFFHASFETLKRRRESREGYNTVEGFWVDPPGYFDKLVWPEYIKNHQHLFENYDVNTNLNTYAKQELELFDIQNEDLTLYDLIDKSLDAILQRLE